MHYRDQNGTPITLGKKLASGGEGTIHLVEGNHTLVAKVYHESTEARVRKLAAMIANPPDDPMAGKHHTSIAWPVSLLWPTNEAPHGRFLVNQGGVARIERQPVGYLMPRVEGMRPVFDFYNPGVRRKYCPLFDYGYLHGAARNLAAAVNALHARGYVIGDVNESNILISNTALATLVDTDSFQVRDAQNGTIHRCPVGKPEFTPPELQGRVFAEVDRTPEHDLFGLGVLAFQLLMEGVHPFAGKFRGSGDPPELGPRISSGHFPHDSAGCRHYGPLPTGLPFSTLNPTLQGLFLRCFVDGHRNPKARPDALTWLYAIQGAADNLISCPENAHHRYSSHLGSCPWCERKERLGGLDVFPSEDAVLKGEHLRPSARRSSRPQTARTPSSRSRQSSPTPTSSTVKSAAASQQRQPKQSTPTPQPIQSPVSRIAAWLPLIPRMIAAHPRVATASAAVVAGLMVIAAVAIHRGTVNAAYRDALVIAQNEEAAADGIAALRSVLTKYPDAPSATLAKSRISQIEAFIYSMIFSRADQMNTPEEAIKEIESVMTWYPDSDQVETAKRKISQIKSAKKRQDEAVGKAIVDAEDCMQKGLLDLAESRLDAVIKSNPKALRLADATAALEKIRHAIVLRQQKSYPGIQTASVIKDLEFVVSHRGESHPAKSLLSAFAPSERENWRSVANEGCAEAQLLMGWCYELGAGVVGDGDMAADYYRKAAEQGNAWAQFKLAKMLGGDLRRTTLSVEAREAWLRKAAEQGLSDAQEALGLCYYDGKQKIIGSDVVVCTIDKDRAAAAKWFRKAAEQGSPAAQCALGFMLTDAGDGIPQDQAAAVMWFRKAANQDISAAQNDLGVMYAAGAGVQKDDHEALQWITKASENEASRNVSDSCCWAIDHNRSLLRSGITDASRLGLVFPDINRCQLRREWWSFHSRKEEPVSRLRRQRTTEPSQPSPEIKPTAGDYRERAKDTKPADMVDFVKQCAELGVPEAQLDLATMCATGKGVPKDEAEAVKWTRTAAEQGDANAQAQLFGLFYAGDMGVQKDQAEAVRWCRKAAEQGNALAELNMGLFYARGNGVPCDLAESARWIKSAAEHGRADAQSYLGWNYDKGCGIAEDKAEAVKWYRRSADQGYAEGQCHLGWCYGNGNGVAMDKTEAVKWYRKAAEQGYALAQRDLAVCYDAGDGVARDPIQAAGWYRKAAEQGDAHAQNNLGVCYKDGDGVGKDAAEAAKWFRRAAEQGFPAAQYNFAFAYAFGMGVTKDVGEATKWYRKAAEQGIKEAEQRLAELGAGSSPRR